MATAGPTRGSRKDNLWSLSPTAALLSDLRFSNPDCRSNRIQEPGDRWNSTPGSLGHSIRYMPKAGRRSRFVAATSSSGGMHSVIRNELVRKASCPPGRSKRAASGTQSCGSAHRQAPYSEITKSKLHIRIWNLLSVAVNQREVETVLELKTPRRGDLR